MNFSAFACEKVSLSEIAKNVGTPCYVYSNQAIRERCRAMAEAFRSHPTLLCYAVKANSNLSVLRTIFAEGFGADIVSVGELRRSLHSGVTGEKVVFSGVGKQKAEIEAALAAGILAFNVESIAELRDLDAVARMMGKTAPVSLRINPNIDVDTNPHIATGLYSTKFGIAESDLGEALERVSEYKNLKLTGMGCHIGSQILESDPFAEAARRMSAICQGVKSQKFPLEFLDLGGGLGVRYHAEETPIDFTAYAQTILASVSKTGLRLVLEPGRSIVANAGILLVSVLNLKQTPEKNFVIVDGAMNDLIRPSLYEAYHAIEADPAALDRPLSMIVADVVGPVCESGDFLGKDRKLPALAPGDLLAVKSCGAYGASMASNYNSRPRAAEVLVEGDRWRVVRRRETLPDLWAAEI